MDIDGEIHAIFGLLLRIYGILFIRLYHKSFLVSKAILMPYCYMFPCILHCQVLFFKDCESM